MQPHFCQPFSVASCRVAFHHDHGPDDASQQSPGSRVFRTLSVVQALPAFEVSIERRFPAVLSGSLLPIAGIRREPTEPHRRPCSQQSAVREVVLTSASDKKEPRLDYPQQRHSMCTACARSRHAFDTRRALMMMMVVMMMAGWVRVDACIYMHTLLQPRHPAISSWSVLTRWWASLVHHWPRGPQLGSIRVKRPAQ